MVYNPKSTNLKKQNIMHYNTKKKVLFISGSVTESSMLGERIREIFRTSPVYGTQSYIEHSSIDFGLKEMYLNDIACVILGNDWLEENAIGNNFVDEAIAKISQHNVQIIVILKRNLFAMDTKVMSAGEIRLRTRLNAIKNKKGVVLFHSQSRAIEILKQYFNSGFSENELIDKYQMESIH